MYFTIWLRCMWVCQMKFQALHSAKTAQFAEERWSGCVCNSRKGIRPCSIYEPEGTVTRKSCLLIGSGMLPTKGRREFSGYGCFWFVNRTRPETLSRFSPLVEELDEILGSGLLWDLLQRIPVWTVQEDTKVTMQPMGEEQPRFRCCHGFMGVRPATVTLFNI